MKKAEFVAAVVGCLLVIAGLAIIWISRWNVHRDLYVSGLGATGEPTAEWFELALIFVVIGGSAIAWAGRAVHSTARVDTASGGSPSSVPGGVTSTILVSPAT